MQEASLRPSRPPGRAALSAAAEPSQIMIVIVGYRNAGDILRCVAALSRLIGGLSFGVLVAENGGPQGMDALLSALGGERSPCRTAAEHAPTLRPVGAVRGAVFDLPSETGGADAQVHVAEMSENLGYAGAINAWLRTLLMVEGWQGVWIVNPDTEPAPAALQELVTQAACRRKGMVGSRIASMEEPDLVRTRGLSWRKLTARTMAVGRSAPADLEPDAEQVEALLDAPSGASLYVTRGLIERIGLMDERYFLYFEDMEWGCRAKAIGELGYAHRSIVPHKGGTTTGSAGGRSAVSRLSVYLDFRNRIIFVGQVHPAWLAWTVIAQTGYALTYAIGGSPRNAIVALRGVVAGLRGETGRPDRMMADHVPWMAERCPTRAAETVQRRPNVGRTA